MIVRYLMMLRPPQWLKNLMLYFPPFLSGQMLLPGMVAKGVLPFIAFCLVSSAGYIFNDLLDRERDVIHPKKCLRAIPAGTVGVVSASILAALLLVCGLFLMSTVSQNALLFLVSYAGISLLYSMVLKNFPVIDLIGISAGFLIRLQAGGEVFKINISPWLFLTVFLLAVFLSTGKRLCEYRLLGANAGEHRKNLALYPAGFLDGIMYMTGGAVLVTYAIYTLNRSTLIYSVPLCCFGLIRYIFRVLSGHSGDPTESLINDRILSVVSLCWVCMIWWSIYR